MILIHSLVNGYFSLAGKMTKTKWLLMARAENKKKTTPKLSWNQVSRFGLNFQRRKEGDSTGSLQTTLSSLYFNFAM